MLVFLDFEASSLAKASYPIEVAWIFEDGQAETYLIRPAPGWTDWDEEAEAIHRIDRATLMVDGTDHETVAQRMIDALTGHDLLASAPSWDGKWLSALLRAAGHSRHSLKLRRSDDAMRETARAILANSCPAGELETRVGDLLTLVEVREARAPPAHRALPDAKVERTQWLAVRDEAESVARKKETND